jgi:hypothetical protein
MCGGYGIPVTIVLAADVACSGHIGVRPNWCELLL